MKENVSLRQNSWENNFSNSGQLSQEAPTIMLDFYLIITIYAKGQVSTLIDLEHKRMQQVLSSLYHPEFLSYLNTNAPQPLPREITVDLFPQQYINEHLGLQLWSALDQNIRPFISLKVTAPLLSTVSTAMTPVKTKELNFADPYAKVFTIKGQTISLNGDTKFPVQATLVHKNIQGETIQTTTANRDGYFSLGPVEMKSHSVHITASGYQNKIVTLSEEEISSSEHLSIILDKSLT